MYFRSFRNLMSIFTCLLPLLIASIGVAHHIPSHDSITNETYTFRWATGGDLNNTLCAVAGMVLRSEGDTEDTVVLKFVSGEDTELTGAALLEKWQADCRNNSSLFVLVGNPGMIWHPESGQCLHTKMKRKPIGYGPAPDYRFVYKSFKTLITSDRCEKDNPALALFKYDNNKPQRLSFLGDVNPNTGNREEWRICHWLSGSIHVAPKCVYYPNSGLVGETFFHEVV